APGAAPNITLTVTSPSSPTTISNTATVSSPNDNNAAHNSATASTTVGIADLSITKTDSPDPVGTSSTLTYTIGVTNTSATVTATSVSVSDTIHAGTTFVSATGTGWSCSNVPPVTCTRATLAPGAAPNLTLTVTSPSSPTTISKTTNAKS